MLRVMAKASGESCNYQRYSSLTAQVGQEPRRRSAGSLRPASGRHRQPPLAVLPGHHDTVLRLQSAWRKISQGIRDNWWRQGMMGGIKAQYDCVKALSETEFFDDLKMIDIPVLVMHGEDDQICPFEASGATVGQAAQVRHTEDLSRLPSRHADHTLRPDQR